MQRLAKKLREEGVYVGCGAQSSGFVKSMKKSTSGQGDLGGGEITASRFLASNGSVACECLVSLQTNTLQVVPLMGQCGTVNAEIFVNTVFRGFNFPWR